MLKRFTGYKRLLALSALSGGAAPVERTATGNPLTFETDLAKPLKSLIANFLPVQASGTPAPDNILPITGWDAVNVWSGGKNIFPVDNISRGYINSSGIFAEQRANALSDYIPYIYGQKITIYLDNAVNGSVWSTGVAYYDENKNYISRDSQGGRQIPYTFNVHSGQGFGYIRIWINRDDVEHSVDELISYGLYAQFGDNFTAYEPYNGTVYPASFPSTIYGGYVDMVTGEVWKTYDSVDLGTFDYVIEQTADEHQYFTVYYAIPNAKKVGNGVVSSYKCSNYKTVNASAIYFGTSGNYAISMVDSSPPGIRIRDDRFETASELKTALDGVILYYDLASPVLITTLTPQQINAIKGNNTVWSDANDSCEVTYLVSAAYAENHPVGGLGSGLLGFGSGNPDAGEPDEPGEPDDDNEQPDDDQQEET